MDQKSKAILIALPIAVIFLVVILLTVKVRQKQNHEPAEVKTPETGTFSVVIPESEAEETASETIETAPETTETTETTAEPETFTIPLEEDVQEIAPRTLAYDEELDMSPYSEQAHFYQQDELFIAAPPADDAQEQTYLFDYEGGYDCIYTAEQLASYREHFLIDDSQEIGQTLTELEQSHPLGEYVYVIGIDYLWNWYEQEQRFGLLLDAGTMQFIHIRTEPADPSGIPALSPPAVFLVAAVPVDAMPEMTGDAEGDG